MRHARSLSFEPLEARKLLSRAHVAASHLTPKAVVAPVALVLNGTLTVDNSASFSAEDDLGDITTTTPVAGKLGSLGEVHGVWNTSGNEFGAYVGPDTLELHNAHGTVVIEFNDANPGPGYPIANGAVFHQQGQQFDMGSGAFTKASERGTIDLNTNDARNAVVSMTLNTGNT